MTDTSKSNPILINIQVGQYYINPGVKIHEGRKRNNCRKFIIPQDQSFSGRVAEKKAKATQMEE